MHNDALDCACVPPEEYGEKDWWLPIGGASAFFFHTPRRGQKFVVRDQNTYCTSSHLEQLIQLFRYYRVKTSPVCEGTKYSPQTVKDTFLALRKVESSLQKEGQEFVNLTTLKTSKFHAFPDWKLPWAKWQDMEESVNHYAGIGRISVLAEEEWVERWCKNLATIPNITINRKENEYQIWVFQKGDSQKRSAWELALSSFRMFAPINL